MTTVEITYIENEDLTLHIDYIKGSNVVDCLVKYTDYDEEELEGLSTNEKIDEIINYIEDDMNSDGDRTLYLVKKGNTILYSNNVETEDFE